VRAGRKEIGEKIPLHQILTVFDRSLVEWRWWFAEPIDEKRKCDSEN
jgi:hypothetical protein